MQITVLHYHFRPGGVRRVIEQGLPALARAAGASRIVLAAGEGPDREWRREIEAALFPAPVHWVIEPALGYWSEQSESAATIRETIRKALQGIVSRDGLLWAHNLSVGRNLLLATEVPAAARESQLWLHHHDWWFDGRWERWPEMQAQGIHSLTEALACTLPVGDRIRHFCVNATDARMLREWTGEDARFVANPVALETASEAATEEARRFLREVTGAEHWWLYPCRGLRRKNIAEALLVQRWLAPAAVTVTTREASSAAERDYFSRLTDTAARHGWPLRTGVCTTPGAPAVNALLAASDAVVVSSLKEGFGLPCYEAAAAGRPLYLRIPRGLEETLEATGIHCPTAWREWPVPRDWFDAQSEATRVAEAREHLMPRLPDELHAAVRSFAPQAGATMDFGRLTLSAQLEVIARPVASLTKSFRELHPELEAPPRPQPPAPNSPTPDQWAAAMLTAAKSTPSPLVADWPARARRFLTPLLHDWLDHPLLWT